MDGSWKLDHDGNIPGIPELLDDLRDFLTAMRVEISDTGKGQLLIRLSSAVPGSGFSLSVSDQRVSIAGSSIRGLWAGLVYLEREMETRCGPFLPLGEIEKLPSWDVQISQSPWGANYLVPDISSEFLSDDAFRLLTHYGINGMTIYGDLLFYVRSEIFPELNHPRSEENINILRDATERAARYGVSLYWVPVLPKLPEDHEVFVHHPSARGSRMGTRPGQKKIYTLCSSDHESLLFIAEVMENLFEKVPLLGGLILIIGGESYYHCYMRPAGEDLKPGGPKTNCSVCGLRQPEDVVTSFVGNTARAVHRVKPNAPVLAWPYSAFRWSADPNQVGMIKRMPSDAGLLSEIDKDQYLRKEGYTKRIWDYSVDFVGPSDRIQIQADACRKCSLPLFIKTETALGLEAIHMPYVPCLHRLGEKWKNVRDLKPDGVLQSWMFFGMWGSRAEELGWWTSWRPESSLQEVLEIIAERDFGAASDMVVAAWGAIGRAVSHLPCIPPYFIGPWFLGPAHPLVSKKKEIPSDFMGALYFLQEMEESLSKARLDIISPLVLSELPESPQAWGFQADDENEAWPTLLKEIESSVHESSRALELMYQAQNIALPGPYERALREEALLVEFFHRTLISTLNALRFLVIRDKPRSGEEKMRSVVQDELDNALNARHIFDEAPWLDLSLRTDARFPSSKDMLEKKIIMLKEYLHESM